MFKRKHKQSLASQIRNFIWPRSGLRRSTLYVWHRITRISGSPHFITIGLVAGIFASFTPFIGFHFMLAAILAWILRGSLLASAFGTFFGNPLTFPFIWISTYNVGGFLLGLEHKSHVDLSLPDGTFMLLFSDPAAFWQALWSVIGPLMVPMLIGAFALGIPVSVFFYFLLKPMVATFQERRRARLAARASHNRARRGPAVKQ
ncbi:MAG TPA: DUF2062 domain-containing protein [Rhizobiales bacterium]|nr:DUF2062 domain-containing protein [Hyphomicrobiales bacterium]